ncbi:hypothetical protein HO133_003497 [Letharia lupina]|uniref:F-box domain-containing protein n=1 Tax=Letharia lupina TaxID=560253 RepID=A0A8H6CB79_9LECA|nr:uncharacterized protein HO133_003497 [Letharia lupina]KAF6220365.1 hypothetical protein HO133_003497 [Letharia lupina]
MSSTAWSISKASDIVGRGYETHTRGSPALELADSVTSAKDVRPTSSHFLLEAAAVVTFFSLPSEIKVQIVETTASYDIENFALCCELVHSLAGATLRQHKVDKELYSRFDSPRVWDAGNSECLAAYWKIQAIAESRCLRLYPKIVIVENCTLSDQNRRRARELGVLSEVRRICDVIFNELTHQVRTRMK